MLSDLPRDLAEEVLSRVPMKHMGAVRFVCKRWNTLTKNRSFLKKHLRLTKEAAAREFMVVAVADYRASLMNVNLHRIYEDVDPSINLQGKLVSLNDSDQGGIYKVHHCDGLLLCIMNNNSRFVVWNPYLGHTRRFETKNRGPVPYSRPVFSIGYENKKSYRSYKVVRFHQLYKHSEHHVRYELYYINSKSCTVRSITIRSDWGIESYAHGASIKGNTYWYAEELVEDEVEDEVEDIPVFLICFDFTGERFGKPISLPFHSDDPRDTVTLSSVRDEQLAVLFQKWETCEMEIWITTKIEPKLASWSKIFLDVDMNPFTGHDPFPVNAGSFFVDEEKKVAVVFDKDRETQSRKMAFIIGEDGYFKIVDCGKLSYFHDWFTYPFICSYVPSLAEIKPTARGVKRKTPSY